MKECLANIGNAQDKQVATYAKKQLHGAVPTEPVTVIIPPDDTVVPAKAIVLDYTPPVAPRTVITCSPLVVPPLMADQASNIASGSTLPAPSSVTVKQEPNTPHQSKRCQKVELQELDFVVVKVHKLVRKEGDRKGKLAPKVEGPYRVAGFTDDSKQMAIFEDADGQTWTRGVADLSLWG